MLLDELNNISKTDLVPKAVPTIDFEHWGINVANATKTGYLFCPEGGIFDMSYPNSKLRRGRVQGDGRICPTLTCNSEHMWVIDTLEQLERDADSGNQRARLRLRRPTERECFRLMGLHDDEISKLTESQQLTANAMYKMAGNSIVVDVLENLFEKLLLPDAKDSKPASNALF